MPASCAPKWPPARWSSTYAPENPAALCRRLQVNAYHPDQRILAPGDLAALRDAGFAVNVWTVNDMSEAKRLVAEGATSIITDFRRLPQGARRMTH